MSLLDRTAVLYVFFLTKYRLTAEMLQNKGDRLEQELYKIIVEVWTKEIISKRWNEALICPMF